MLRHLPADTAYAIRSLRHRPIFTVVILVTLALGIGANTAMFAALRVALFRELPYAEPDRLVMGRATMGGHINPTASAYDFFDYRDQSDVFASLAAIAPFPLATNVLGAGEPERVNRMLISWDLMSTLGVEPHVGRSFLQEEGTAQGSGVVLLSYGYWQRRFGGDRDVVGRVLTVGGQPHTVVGVMPAGFHLLGDPAMWTPMWRDGPYAGGRQWHNWIMVGRLLPGLTIRQAQAQMDVISAQLEQEYPDSNTDKALLLTDLQSALTEGHRPNLLLLMAAVGLVLLIGCANVAGLLLARGTARRQELAVRAAMGASSCRLVSQMLWESLLLAVTAGVLGLALAAGLVRILPSLVRLGDLGIPGIGLEPPVLLFALGLSLITGLLFGTLPALRGSGAEVVDDLRSGARGTEPAGTSRLRGALVVGQVAISLMLLVGAGLLIRSLTVLAAREPGFDAANLLTAEVQLPATEYPVEERAAFYASLQERIEAIPGVERVGLITQLPIREQGNNIPVWLPDNPPADFSEHRLAYTRVVMPGYFEAMCIPLLEGRDVAASDGAATVPYLVVSRSMAEGLFEEEHVVGRTVVLNLGQPVEFQIVGVVDDVAVEWIGNSDEWTMYGSYHQQPYTIMQMAVRTALPPATLARDLRAAVAELDPNLPLSEVLSMESLIAGSLTGREQIAGLLAIFSAVALVMAALGLYGMMAYYVSRRVREIGIRMALGAGTRHVAGLVVGRALVPVGIGLVVGLAGALAATRLIGELLYQVDAADPITYATTSGFFVLVAVAVCLLPVVRACRIDPVDALRAE